MLWKVSEVKRLLSILTLPVLLFDFKTWIVTGSEQDLRVT